MNIVVLVKQVPDTWAERKLKDADATLDRASVDGLINELDEYAIEEGLQIAEAQRAAGNEAEVTILTMGPEKAAESIRKALSMGADRAVHLSDDALAGSDAVQTARALAQAIGTLDGVDLILAGKADPSFIVSHDLPLEAAPDAYAKFDKRADGYTKVILKPQMRA